MQVDQHIRYSVSSQIKLTNLEPGRKGQGTSRDWIAAMPLFPRLNWMPNETPALPEFPPQRAPGLQGSPSMDRYYQLGLGIQLRPRLHQNITFKYLHTYTLTLTYILTSRTSPYQVPVSRQGCLSLFPLYSLHFEEDCSFHFIPYLHTPAISTHLLTKIPTWYVPRWVGCSYQLVKQSYSSTYLHTICMYPRSRQVGMH